VTPTGTYPKVEWDSEPVTITAHEAMRNYQRPEGDRKSAREVCDWLLSKLYPYALPSTQLSEAAEAEGITPKQLEHAQSKLKKEGKIDTRKTGGRGEGWEWFLVHIKSEQQQHPLDTLPEQGKVVPFKQE
jgi:hypothetical protein